MLQRKKNVKKSASGFFFFFHFSWRKIRAGGAQCVPVLGGVPPSVHCVPVLGGVLLSVHCVPVLGGVPPSVYRNYSMISLSQQTERIKFPFGPAHMCSVLRLWIFDTLNAVPVQTGSPLNRKKRKKFTLFLWSLECVSIFFLILQITRVSSTFGIWLPFSFKVNFLKRLTQV